LTNGPTAGFGTAAWVLRAARSTAIGQRSRT
jgi:hypothetical protein